LSFSAAIAALAFWGTPLGADPEVGDLFDTPPGQAFRGWNLMGGAIAPDHTSYAIFEHQGVYMIALTTPIARTDTGGITAEKITKLQRVEASPGEVYVNGPDCMVLGVMPAVAFYAKGTGIARGYFVFRGEVREERWFPGKNEPCEYGGD
jgi:hypothetical protein